MAPRAQTEDHINEFRSFKREYAERGKRIDSLESITDDIRNDFKSHYLSDEKHFASIEQSVGEMHKDIKELLEILSALSWGKKAGVGLLWFIGSVIAIIIGLKNISGWFR